MKLQITQAQLCQILTGALHYQVESVEIVDTTEETQKDIAVNPRRFRKFS